MNDLVIKITEALAENSSPYFETDSDDGNLPRNPPSSPVEGVFYHGRVCGIENGINGHGPCDTETTKGATNVDILVRYYLFHLSAFYSTNVPDNQKLDEYRESFAQLQTSHIRYLGNIPPRRDRSNKDCPQRETSAAESSPSVNPVVLDQAARPTPSCLPSLVAAGHNILEDILEILNSTIDEIEKTEIVTNVTEIESEEENGLHLDSVKLGRPSQC